jgi:hypothetical protein
MITAKHLLRSLSEAKPQPVPPKQVEKAVYKIIYDYLERNGERTDADYLSPVAQEDEDREGTILVYLTGDIRGESLKGLVEHLDSELQKKWGWFIRWIQDVTYKSFGNIVRLEPFFGELLDPVPRYLYHFSGSENRDKILGRGLLPKKGSYWHYNQYPPSVFLTLKPSKDAFGTTFIIDTTKLRPGTKFYLDPGWSSRYGKETGVFTYTHIPPEAISIA